MNILIAEDEPLHRDLLSSILAQWPEHQVTIVKDGLAALDLLTDPKRLFDLVFLDLKMPRLGGLELLQRLREGAMRRSAKFVICSAVNDRATISKAVLLGAKRYIIKPCSPTVVAETLRQVGSSSTPPA
jgi:two-component system response regulator